MSTTRRGFLAKALASVVGGAAITKVIAKGAASAANKWTGDEEIIWVRGQNDRIGKRITLKEIRDYVYR